VKVRSGILEKYGPFKTGKMKFFIDPKIANLDDEKQPRAIYTYEPVPAMLLDGIVEILTLNSNGNAVKREPHSLAEFKD